MMIFDRSYDIASMKGGVRGKYVGRQRKGSNLVLIDPEVAAAFPSAEAVNEALRGVLNTTRAVRRQGGLANRALQPASRGKQARGARRAGDPRRQPAASSGGPQAPLAREAARRLAALGGTAPGLKRPRRRRLPPARRSR
jgi:hypothetical protein